MPESLDPCAGWAELGENRVREPRPGFFRPVPEAVSQTRAREPRLGIDPQEAAALPEVPERARRVRAPVQCGRFSSRSSKPSPQSFGSMRPKPGNTPVSPGNATSVASPASPARSALGPAARGRARAGRRACRRRRRPANHRAKQPGRAAPARQRASSRGKGSPPGLRSPWRAPRSRRSSRSASCPAARSAPPLGRQPGCMRQEMADGRARRPGGARPSSTARLPRPPQAREGGQELRDRGPRKRCSPFAGRARFSGRIGDPNGRSTGRATPRPAAAPPRAAILAPVERRLVPADSPYAPIVGYSRAVRVGDQIHVSGTAAVMPDGALSRPGHTPRRGGASKSSSTRSRNSAPAPRTWFAHASTSPRPTTGRRSAARTARSSARFDPRARCS